MSITEQPAAQPGGVEPPVEPWRLTDRELLGALTAAHRAVVRAQAGLLALVAELDSRGLAVAAGSPGTAAWLTANLRLRHGTARTQVRLAKGLAELPATRAALGQGSVNAEHAAVIADTLGDLPPSVDAETMVAAEQTLISHATEMTPTRLARIGTHLIAVLDPDGPEPTDALPGPDLYLNLRTAPDGTCAGEFRLDPLTALTLTALIDAGAAPRPSTTDGPDPRTPARRRADALTDLIRTAAASPRPTPGAGRPTIAVTLTLAELRAGLPVLGPQDQTLTPAQTRRLACDAQIIPAVLGGAGEVLDIGRATRTVPTAIRRALILRDNGCAFPRCQRPPGWTDAHHITHWAHGGPTALPNLVLLCGHHHDTVHHHGWTITMRTSKPVFHPPPHLAAA